MATYVNNLRLKEIATGDESGTWGTSTNTNLELIGDALGYNTQDGFATDADATTTVADGAADPARALYFKVTSSATLTATRTLTIGPNTVSRVMWIENATTGSQSINISQGSGANVTIPTGAAKIVYLDGAGSGAAVVDALGQVDVGDGTVTSVSGTGTVNGISLSGTVTSSGNITLGGALTGVDLTSQVTGTLPVANGGTGITSLGSGVATWLGTPSSANLATAVTDETGSGALVFGTSPSLTTPKVVTGINDTNGAELIKVTATSSAVNEVTVANAATGNNPALSATGDDTNVGIDITPKGTGEAHFTSSFLTGVYSDKVNALGNTGTAQTITFTDGAVVTATLTGNCTFTLASPNGISSRASSFTLVLTNDGTPSRTVAWAGGTFKFPGGAASLSRSTGANEIDVWVFFTPDGGTTYYGNIVMTNLAT